jgi:hypothetical protein
MQGRAADGGKALSTARARLAEAQAEAAELKNAIARGDFIALKVIETGLATLFGVIRELILTLPGKIADAVSAHSTQDRAEIFQILKRECREILVGLSSPAVISAAMPIKSVSADDADGAGDTVGSDAKRDLPTKEAPLA